MRTLHIDERSVHCRGHLDAPVPPPHMKGEESHGRPAKNGDRPMPDRSQSRFFCNRVRTAALVCFVIALAALVIGGGFAEISANGSPTAAETAVVRWIILGALVAGLVAYVVGGRIQAGRQA